MEQAFDYVIINVMKEVFKQQLLLLWILNRTRTINASNTVCPRRIGRSSFLFETRGQKANDNMHDIVVLRNPRISLGHWCAMVLSMLCAHLPNNDPILNIRTKRLILSPKSIKW